MRIAYIISAYRLPEQLVRLVNRLNEADVAFFIHVDRKTDEDVFERMRKPLAGLKNVHFLERHVCHYCDFGHVSATLKGIREMVRAGMDFDYVILLTGQDYPLTSNRRIRETLQDSQGKSYITHWPLPCRYWSGNGGVDRFAYWHVRFRGKRLSLPHDNPFRSPVLKGVWTRFFTHFPLRRKFPDYVKPYGGDSYWCLSKACILHIHAFLEAHPDYVRFFRNVHIPDEIFFQTILLNSKHKEELVNDDLRYVDWSKPAPPYPAVLTRKDYLNIMQSGDLFARKFDAAIDSEILDMLDRENNQA